MWGRSQYLSNFDGTLQQATSCGARPAVCAVALARSRSLQCEWVNGDMGDTRLAMLLTLAQMHVGYTIGNKNMSS